MTGPLVPFREIVLKVHSRCDLACDHCYIYEHADQSWRTRPRTISDDAIIWTARRLAEHAKTHALPSVTVILHGGEPLLAGPARLRRICEELISALDGVAALDLRIHTNGLQLSPRYLDLFDEFGVRVGISLDGDRAANDRHRRFADGRSSHPLVLRAVELLHQDRYRHLDLGLLCTVDVRNDPVAVYDALMELDPPRIDFLLPHATWDEPPLRPGGSPTVYADWILTVFDRWDRRRRPVPVRLFESVLSTLSGGSSLTESLGLAPTDLVVVETDGTLEQVDSLKSAYEGAAATGFTVFDHSLDEVAAHPGIRARQLGLAGVGETCRQCPVVRSCGGGLYTHRYRGGRDFDNTSVYCTDLEALIRGVEQRTAAGSVPPAVTDAAALRTEQHELAWLLLAGLHDALAGRGSEDWARAWELMEAVEHSDGLGFDEVLAHPYTVSWLHEALDVLEQEPLGAAAGTAPAARLSAAVAAAAVRGGPELTVPVPYERGVLYLPTLGELRLTGAEEHGMVQVRPMGEGFLVRGAGNERRITRLAEPAAGWRPVRRLRQRAEAVPDLAIDDLDPHRDCYGVPAAPRLGSEAAADWTGRLAAAWSLLRERAPRQADAAAACLTTLTPLSGREPAVGRHGLGALGLPLHADVPELALALLRGHRRARFQALREVTDLYAQDGWWSHQAPWAEAPVPVSELLAGAYERAGLAGVDPEAAEQALRALTTLERAAELTVSGKRLLTRLGEELGEEVNRDLCRV
ncbi:radical SAM/SPASM protein FxsB, inactivated metallohydrolase extension form [Streptomyces sp. SCSIO 30461]|uniref:radical SAM/SPASM protein FxsBH, inactivated beta-hydroxylase extension form n=1 Tax=Streptomyces sp. SCSIO 30461 TaxID=3118085 RepID=UPI0030CA6F61